MLGVSTVLAALGAQGMPAISTSGKVRRGRTVHSGGTFNEGRNAEKRKARADEARLRATQVATATYRPKNNLSWLTTDMLANRRLRQRSVGRG